MGEGHPRDAGFVKVKIVGTDVDLHPQKTLGARLVAWLFEHRGLTLNEGKLDETRI